VEKISAQASDFQHICLTIFARQQLYIVVAGSPLHNLSNHIDDGDIFNPQRLINEFMFFSLSELNLEDHLGLVI